MAQGDEVNRRFAESAHRILAGERDDEALTENLNRETAYMIRAILQQLSGTPPHTSEVLETSEVSENTQNASEEISFADFLDELLNGVVAASQPNVPAELRSQLHTVTQALAQDTNLPPEIRALGQALHAILNGNQPDLAALPPELAATVEQVLAQR